jgi:protein gp37
MPIEWTDTTWNPLRGCRRVSPGCEHCYAERQAARPILSGPGKPYDGLVTLGRQGPRWTGDTAGPDHLDEPLHWRAPRRVFVCSMSDLFYGAHTNEAIAQVFSVMARASRHTFQVLTKRPERARILLSSTQFQRWVAAPVWPLPNVWVGTSIEQQRYVKSRTLDLLGTPAAVRFLSVEPLLERVRLGLLGTVPVDWVIVGGESGPGARPCSQDWIRDVVQQCAAAQVPVFVKQLGSHSTPPCGGRVRLNDRKGGDPSEWPEGLRVRQFPEEVP